MSSTYKPSFKWCFYTMIYMICWLLLPARSVAAGFIPVRNFERAAYHGGPQNWAAVQDSLGRLYVGNRDGVITFDGARWRLLQIPNYTTVRSLLCDNQSGRIYAGGSEEFGFFAPDSVSGILRYHSLINTLPAAHSSFTEIWNIYMVGNKVWFQGDYCLLRYDGNTTIDFPVDGRISRSAVIGNNIYIALDNGELLRFNGIRLIPLEGTELLHNKKIHAILPLADRNSLLIATANDGLFSYDGISAKPFPTPANDFLKRNQVFCGAASGSNYVFGTVDRGAVVININSGSIKYINKESGLQNNTVLSASFDKDGNLWLCLDNGLAYAIYNSPYTNLITASNEAGAGYASALDGNSVYFGTNQGLYSSDYPFSTGPSPIELHRELRGQIWHINHAGGSLFVSADRGLFYSDNGGFTQVENVPGTNYAAEIPGHPDQLLASTYAGFHLISRQGNRWTDSGPIDGYNDISGNFVSDSNGYIWLSHWRKGIYRLKYDNKSRSFSECILYNHQNGLPTPNNNTVSIYRHRPVFATQSGFYTFDYAADSIVPDTELNNIFPLYPVSHLHVFPSGVLVISSNNNFISARQDGNGEYQLDNTSFSALHDKIIPGYDNLTYLNNNEIIVSNQEGFWCVDPEHRSASAATKLPFVNSIYANSDSLIYYANVYNSADLIELPNDLNSLRFEFSYPDYRSSQGVEYSVFLENYDSDWTPYSSETSREYTRLSEGDYTLYLRAHDLLTNRIEENKFAFHIAPPWFRTPLAKTLYTIVLAVLLVTLYMQMKKILRKAQRQVEQRKEKEMAALRHQTEQEALVKDYEIATLKSEQLEHDIRHKSSELSNTTMNLVRKNEILTDIADKIAQIQSSTASTPSTAHILRELVKIQNEIAENISHDDDLKRFTQNFDVVYENYTKRLLELHPNLTAADKRICCYIKMGLSSKEIAPLVNISYKSVEMTRYRLRKKMNLAREISLTDYLQNL